MLCQLSHLTPTSLQPLLKYLQHETYDEMLRLFAFME